MAKCILLVVNFNICCMQRLLEWKWLSNVLGVCSQCAYQVHWNILYFSFLPEISMNICRSLCYFRGVIPDLPRFKYYKKKLLYDLHDYLFLNWEILLLNNLCPHAEKASFWWQYRNVLLQCQTVNFFARRVGIALWRQLTMCFHKTLILYIYYYFVVIFDLFISEINSMTCGYCILTRK